MSTVKRIITILLLCFVVSSTVVAIYQVIESARQQESGIDWSSEDHFIAFYFHGNKRCSMCNDIEKYTRQAITTNYGDRVEFRVINWQDSNNKAYVRAYELIGNAVVLVEIRHRKQHRFKNLEKLWDFAHSEREFTAYIKEEVDRWIQQ